MLVFLLGPDGLDLPTRRLIITAATVDASNTSAREIPSFRCCLVRDTEGTAASSKLSEPITDPAALVTAVSSLFEGADREIFVAVALDARNRAIGSNIVSVGTLTTSLVHPREIFKFAILAGAATIALAHNHPSGDPTPSKEDVDLTRRMVQAGELVGIEVIDHVILALGGEWESLRERGVM